MENKLLKGYEEFIAIFGNGAQMGTEGDRVRVKMTKRTDRYSKVIANFDAKYDRENLDESITSGVKVEVLPSYEDVLARMKQDIKSLKLNGAESKESGILDIDEDDDDMYPLPCDTRYKEEDDEDF